MHLLISRSAIVTARLTLVTPSWHLSRCHFTLMPSLVICRGTQRLRLCNGGSFSPVCRPDAGSSLGQGQCSQRSLLLEHINARGPTFSCVKHTVLYCKLWISFQLSYVCRSKDLYETFVLIELYTSTFCKSVFFIQQVIVESHDASSRVLRKERLKKLADILKIQGLCQERK